MRKQFINIRDFFLLLFLQKLIIMYRMVQPDTEENLQIRRQADVCDEVVVNKVGRAGVKSF